MAETDYKINVTADTSQADAALNSSASTISKIESVSKRLGTYVTDVSNKIKSAFDYASKGVTNYDEELKKALVSTSSVKNAVDKISLKELLKDVDKTTNRLESLNARYTKLNAIGTSKASSSFRSLMYDIKTTTGTLNGLNAQLMERLPAAIDEIKDKMSEMSVTTVPTDKYKALEAQYKAMQPTLDDLRKQMELMDYIGLSHTERSWKDVEVQFKAVSAEMQKLKDQQAELEASGEAYQIVPAQIPTKEYAALEKQITKAEEKLAKLEAKQNAMSPSGVGRSSASWKNLKRDIEMTKAEIDRYAAAQDALKANDKAFTPVTQSKDFVDLGVQLQDYQTRLAAARGDNESFFARIAGGAESAGAAIMSKLGVGVSRAAALASKHVHKIIEGFKKSVKQANLLNKASKKLSKTLTGIRRMFVSRLKRMAISAIFSDMTATFQKLAGISPRFNKSVSGMIDSAKALGAQMVAAIEPLVSKVGPIISAVIDKMTEGANAISQFTARAFGDTTFFKATKGQSDYAKSLDNTTKSTNKANAAANKYKRTVLGFDQLNKLTDQDDNEIGIDSADLKQAETDATVLNNIADDLNEAVTSGNFEGVGETIAKGFNYITRGLSNAIGWSKNQDAITGTLTKIADVINGFSEGLLYYSEEIGSNIADIGNTIVNGAAVLLEKIDALQLGSAIGTTLKRTIENFDWTTLGADIVNGIEFALDFVTGFFNSGALESLGTALSDSIKGMIHALDPGKWADALTAVVNSIFGFFANINISIQDFKELGDKIVQFIVDTLNDLDWATIQAGIGNILSLLINAIAGLLQSLAEAIFSPDTWIAIGKTIYNAVMALFVTVVNGIIDAFNAVIETINGIGAFDAPDWGGIMGMSGQKVEFVHIELVPHLQAPYLADGGIVGDGQLFIANEKGPELIGTDGKGNTAVVNNEQIISAVVAGVRQAVMEAGMTIAERVADSNGTGSGDTVIEIDSIEIARAVNRGNKRIGRRSNHNVNFA